MPTADRRLMKQNLSRSKGHIDKLKEYYLAIGTPFAEQGTEHYGEDLSKWPPEYLVTLAAIDALTAMCDTMAELHEKLEETI